MNGTIASRISAALSAGHELDLDGEEVPAAVLAEILTGAVAAGAPALRLRDATFTGVLRLTGARVPFPVELRACRFAHAPDLRMADLAGLALTDCVLPGLRAGNLRVTADLALDDGFTAEGQVNLTDARIGGSLRLSGGRLLHGTNGRALVADRIVVGGTCYARRLHSTGELRMPGARITGNIDLAGAQLTTPTADALDATGVTIGGSLLAGRHDAGPDLAFRSTGRVLLAGARIGGDLVFSGARVSSPPGAEPPPPMHPAEETRVPMVPGGIVDATACLVADRVRVDGNLELDDGLATTGTVRLPNAVVGGYLRLSGATMTGPHGASDRGIALLGDGMEVGGDLEARDDGRGALACRGQLRLVDARVRGSASLSGVHLAAPDGYALLGDRLRIGGEFFLRDVRCSGTIRLENADIGATVDCAGAQLDRPRVRADHTVRPSLDARAATVGKDLLCTDGFTATGGVRVRRMDVRKSVQFVDVKLGGATPADRPGYALNAYGLTTGEFIVRPAGPPIGPVRLEQAQVRTFGDSPELWQATGGVSVDGFAYDLLGDSREIDVRRRLAGLVQAMPSYLPGPYDQLAAAYRRAGYDNVAERVLIARQTRRYSTPDAGTVSRIWGRLQRYTVGYGYRPWLAVCWLVFFAVLGGLWFTFHVPLPIDDGQHPVFNPWIFAADTLLPIVNLGQDGYWQLDGAAQWIAGGLVSAGWILATTAAAGAARILKRV